MGGRRRVFNFDAFLFRFPKMAAWYKRMLKEPAVKALETDPKILMRFLNEIMRQKKSNYDELEQ